MAASSYSTLIPRTTSFSIFENTQSSFVAIEVLNSDENENEVSRLVLEDCGWSCFDWRFHGAVHDQNRLLYDKVTVLESEKRAWEASPEAQAVRDALNPWRKHEAERKSS
ncbi:hypothetical protein Pint_25012 [Pistacia integerrima]|uniref:Uncharacterized protein n=1 Tax=Pistacia integerrima TaxID=434235 RepID=A0ACC0YDL4_9ROSI|nr:hypothetical protein Pint_25012 [Pistacia integerrima]